MSNLTTVVNNIVSKVNTHTTDLSNKATKIGTIITFPINSVPTGYLECNGANLSRTAYANLFAVIGTIYGAGNGSTTFAIPDLRGEFIRGWDNGRGVDTGRNIGSYQADAYKSHTHTGSTNSTGAHSHLIASGSIYGAGYNYGTNIPNSEGTTTIGRDSNVNTNSTGSHSHTVSIDASGSIETRPRNIAMMYCIKY